MTAEPTPTDRTHAYRTHTCGALRASDAGRAVRLSGWIHRKRDHGGLMFIDLRDHYGVTQLVLSPTTPGFELAERLRAESVIRVDGEAVARSADTVNPGLPTGEIEVRVSGLTLLSEAAELPVPVFGEPDYPEELRLKYRYLDLRRETLHRNIVLRSNVVASIRRRMVEAGFTEFATPILTASSPEGARDYLVPSRLYPGQFYALPQAPQQFKQLLMVAGFDRYFQIAPCFRDEAARADRSPGEFYQLDLEMSFVTQEDVFQTIEPVIRGVFEEFAEGKPVNQSFPRIPYREAIAKYGSDKPDLRNPIEMQDVSEHFRGGGFGVFARILEGNPKARIWAIPAHKNGEPIGRAFADRMDGWAKGEGQPGMAYIFWRDSTVNAEERFNPNSLTNKLARVQQIHTRNRDEAVSLEAKSPRLGLDQELIDSTFAHRWPDFDQASRDQHALETPETYFEASGPVARNLGVQRSEALRQQLGLSVGDAVFFAAGDPAEMYRFAGSARTRVGTELGLVDENRFELCWIVDFPMYEWNEEEKKIDFSHNPFSMPQGEMEALLTKDPLDILAYQYDIVCNGVELSSGAIRNHRPDIMLKAFEIAGYDAQTVEDRFGGMLNAFCYGAPPHGGIAPGIDRIVMLLAGVTTIRDVIAFPLNQQAQDLMMQAPAPVSEQQLKELHLRIAPPIKV